MYKSVKVEASVLSVVESGGRAAAGLYVIAFGCIFAGNTDVFWYTAANVWISF
jgi:hypothetical protein